MPLVLLFMHQAAFYSPFYSPLYIKKEKKKKYLGYQKSCPNIVDVSNKSLISSMTCAFKHFNPEGKLISALLTV